MAGAYGTQCERILQYLSEHETITQAEAITKISVYRLASRINDLKKQGYAIRKETVRGKNKYGEPTHFARYSLEKYEGAESETKD